ncbi:MAG: hypothetical protein ABI599_09455 [Flavobacteriales bacterium]
MKTMKPLTTTITIAVLLSATTKAQESASSARDHDNVFAVEAVVLSANSSVHIQDDNSRATLQGDFIPGSQADRQWGTASVWHAFTLTEKSNLTIDLGGTEFVQPGAFFDGLLPEPVTAGNTITADALYLSAAKDGNYAMTFLALSPGTYYLPIGCIPDFAEGRYVLTVNTTPYPGEVVTR